MANSWSVSTATPCSTISPRTGCCRTCSIARALPRSPAIRESVIAPRLLGKLQVGEFSSIIGLIKRAQRVYGRMFTISGVIAGFRKSALHDVGYWSTDMVTEDIDISWRLQMQPLGDPLRTQCAVLDSHAGNTSRPVEAAPALGPGRLPRCCCVTPETFAGGGNGASGRSLSEYTMSMVWSYIMAIDRDALGPRALRRTCRPRYTSRLCCRNGTAWSSGWCA